MTNKINRGSGNLLLIRPMRAQIVLEISFFHQFHYD